MTPTLVSLEVLRTKGEPIGIVLYKRERKVLQIWWIHRKHHNQICWRRTRSLQLVHLPPGHRYWRWLRCPVRVEDMTQTVVQEKTTVNRKRSTTCGTWLTLFVCELCQPTWKMKIIATRVGKRYSGWIMNIKHKTRLLLNTTDIKCPCTGKISIHKISWRLRVYALMVIHRIDLELEWCGHIDTKQKIYHGEMLL